jgi:predicted PurR-regulated permease PerM
MLGGRRTLASILVTLLLLLLLLVPVVYLSTLLVENVAELAKDYRDQGLVIPPPPESVSSWPVVGQFIANVWQLAATNLGEAVKMLEPQLKAAGSWLLGLATSSGMSLLVFSFAFVIAGLILRWYEDFQRIARALAERLASGHGDEYAELARATIRSVARGVLGVAVIQALLAGLGFVVAGVPGAGLWAFLCLLTATVQIGVGPIVIPVIIYLFFTASTLTAVLFLVWGVFLMVVDNILKPMLLGRGVKVPMLVIFLGAFGGLMMSGIIGLFVGAIVLALGYKLLQAWLEPGGTSPKSGDA